VKVRDLMATHVEFIDPDATVQDAAALMGELDVSALPIGTAEALKGVITDRDILYRVVAEGRDPRRTAVLEVATRQIFSCSPEDTLKAAMDLMASQNVRRLPVMDEAQRVIGWLTLSDLSRHLLVESELVQGALREVTAT
jgi:CBS domain-containing protein